MLKRSTYDWLTGGFVVLLIGFYLLLFYFIKSNPSGIENVIKLFSYSKIFSYGLFLIYYIFILVLAIQLHSKKYLSITNTVITAIIVPLAPIYYLFTIRKALKKFESENTSLNH